MEHKDTKTQRFFLQRINLCVLLRLHNPLCLCVFVFNFNLNLMQKWMGVKGLLTFTFP